MYNKEFSKIYKDSGWELFADVFGNFLIKYFVKKEKPILSHLDLACGTGYLCNLFNSFNIETSGMDISESMLEIARKSYPNITFTQGDMIDFKNLKKVDLVTCTCDSLNHLSSLTNVQNAVKTAYKNLNENGYFAFDIVNTRKIRLEKTYGFKTEHGDIEYFFTINDDDKLITNITVTDNNGKEYKKKIEELAINKSDMNSILTEVGFKIEKVYPSIKATGTKLNLKWFYICKKETPKKKKEMVKYEKRSKIWKNFIWPIFKRLSKHFPKHRWKHYHWLL